MGKHLVLPLATIGCALTTIVMILVPGVSVSSSLLSSLTTLTVVLSVLAAQNAARQVRERHTSQA